MWTLAERVIKNPDWDKFTLDNDAAIVKLGKNVSFTAYIRTYTVCLPDVYVEKDQ